MMYYAEQDERRKQREDMRALVADVVAASNAIPQQNRFDWTMRCVQDGAPGTPSYIIRRLVDAERVRARQNGN